MPAVTVKAAPVDETLEHLSTPVNTGALGNRSQFETPFSTTVVTAADIQERQVNKLGDVFALDASVSDNSASYDAWASYLTVRGLPLDWQNSYRIDGKPFLSYVTTLPFEQFEQIDLLKGASGFMYGFGSPGGLVNYVTKKPTIYAGQLVGSELPSQLSSDWSVRTDYTYSTTRTRRNGSDKAPRGGRRIMAKAEERLQRRWRVSVAGHG
ncbi:hypothetical protein ACMZ4X_03497 [Achromobacter marplatensis]